MPMRTCGKVLCWSHGFDSCYRQPHPPEACCHCNFSVRHVHGGSLENHTSSRPCFVEDGPTGWLHQCSGLDGRDEEFVWTEGWPERHQQPAVSHCYRANKPTRKLLLTANHCRLRLEWAQGWENLTMAHWQHVIFDDESRFRLYPVDGRLKIRFLPGERFQQRWQAYRVQGGGSWVYVLGVLHSGAKSPLVLPNSYLTGELYRSILQNNLVTFARQHFRDKYRCQEDNATPHHARAVLDFLPQGNVTQMEQRARSPGCNPIEHIWDELGCAITSMDNPPQNLGELR